MFYQLNQKIAVQTILSAEIYLRAEAEGSYFSLPGEGHVYIDSMKSWKEEAYVGEDNIGKAELNRKATPLEFKNQTFEAFYFDPTSPE